MSETTTKPEPITPAQPPASNPGAEDPTAGIAKDAGGVSSAAHVQSPTAPKEKRKSIVGQLTGFLGLGGGKKEKEARNASQDNSVAGTVSGAAAGTAATAAAGTAVLADRTKSTVQETTGVDMGAKGKDTADTGAAEPTTTTEETPAEHTPAQATEKATGDKTTETSGGDGDKDLKPADPKTMENRSAIPVAGGEKLGEKHWGESKIVPENPKPADEEGGAAIASKDGQPSSKQCIITTKASLTNFAVEEVSDNTAANTGGATSGPSGSKSPESGEKKEKFMDKIKSKFNKNKA